MIIYESNKCICKYDSLEFKHKVDIWSWSWAEWTVATSVPSCLQVYVNWVGVSFSVERIPALLYSKMVLLCFDKFIYAYIMTISYVVYTFMQSVSQGIAYSYIFSV